MSEEVVDLLRKSYTDELETAMDYLITSTVLDGDGHEVLKDSMQAVIQEELGHAQQLKERLHQLGARLPAHRELQMGPESLQPPANNAGALSVIDTVITADENAMATYRALIDAAVAAGDPVTEELAVMLLAAEKNHRTEFQALRKEYRVD